jgi:hypothetical protein
LVATIHVDSTGTAFRQTLVDGDGVAIDLTGATTVEFIFERPDETQFTRTATVVGLATAGLIQYVALNGEFDMPGSWRYQAHVVIPSGEWWADVADFEAMPNL